MTNSTQGIKTECLQSLMDTQATEPPSIVRKISHSFFKIRLKH